MRPRHWIKNSFVFVPAFFAQKIYVLFDAPSTALTFLSFCWAASIVYIFNDWMDRKEDALHPLKKNRPFASGKLDRRQGLLLIGVLFLVLGTTLYFSGVWWPVLAYLLLNVMYSTILKHLAIVDISCIAMGFVLRVIAGGEAAQVLLSPWLIVMTFLLAMCVALGKRRSEFLLQPNTRKVLSTYNLDFINIALILLTTTTLVAYLMYCMSEEVTNRFQSDTIFYTAFFVLLGLLRYLQIAIVDNDAGSPHEILWKDRFLQLVLLCWILTFYLLIY